VAAIVGWAYQANAITVGWGDEGGPFLTYSDGLTLLPQGTVVKIGSDTTGDLAGFTLWSAGVDIDSDPGGTAKVGEGTDYDGTFTEPSFGSGAGFFGAQIYLEVGSGNALVTNPSWKFPGVDYGAVDLDTGDPGLVIIVGSYSTGTITDPNLGAGSDALVTTIPVPEPSSIALVIVGLLGGAGLIRRRH
jgi:hypothetical protein